MTVRRNGAEGGSDGTTVTTGNSGAPSGDAFGSVTIGGTGALTFSSTQAMHGALSYAYAPDATTGTYVSYTGLSATQGVARFYLYLTGNPSASMILAAFGSTNLQYVGITTAGKVFLDTSGGGVVWTATTALSLNTWYRIETAMTVAAGTATTKVSYYAGDSLTATDSFTSSAGNTGTTAYTSFRLGKINNTATIATFYVDDIAFDDASTTFFGPATAAATASGSITLGGIVSAPASASGSVTLSGTATGTPGATATASGSITLGGTATVTPPVSATVGSNLGASVTNNRVQGATVGIQLVADTPASPMAQVTITANVITDAITTGIDCAAANLAEGPTLTANRLRFTGPPSTAATRVGIKTAAGGTFVGNTIAYSTSSASGASTTNRLIPDLLQILSDDGMRIVAITAGTGGGSDQAFTLAGANVTFIGNHVDDGGRTDSNLIASTGSGSNWTFSGNTWGFGGVDKTGISGTVMDTDSPRVAVPASTTAGATLRVPHGAAPSAPVNGDMWTTTAGLFVRINGVTVGPLT